MTRSILEKGRFPLYAAGKPGEEHAGRRLWLDLLLILGLILLTYSVFAPSIRNDYIWLDDQQYVAGNPLVLNGLTWTDIKWAFVNEDFGYHLPLLWISYMADSEMYHGAAWGYHLTNTLLHCGCVVLLYLLLKSVLQSRPRALIAAAIFAVHPLRVESVVWIAERKDVLSMFFGLLTLNSYVWYTRRPGAGRLALTLGLYVLSLMSKPLFVTLPALLVILDIWPLQRHKNPSNRPISRLLIEKIPFLLLACVQIAFSFFVSSKIGALRPLSSYGIAPRLTNALVGYAWYLLKQVKFDDLAIIYPLPDDQWPVLYWAGAMLLLVSITALVFWRRKKNPWLLAGWLWFGGAMVPMIGLNQSFDQSIADRFTYLPCIGLLIMLVCSIPQGWFNRPMKRAGLIAAVVIALGFMINTTRIYADQWKDAPTLFEHERRMAKDNVWPYAVQAEYYFHHGRSDLAMPYLKEGLARFPQYPPFWYWEGVRAEGEAVPDYEHAKASYEKAIRGGMNKLWPYDNYGAILREVDHDYDRAIKLQKKALELFPYYPSAHVQLALDYMAQDLKGHEAEIEYELNKALEYSPGDPAAMEAMQDFQQARGR